MPKLRLTYEGHLIYKTSHEERRAFYLQYRKIVFWDSIHELAYDIPKKKLSGML